MLRVFIATLDDPVLNSDVFMNPHGPANSADNLNRTKDTVPMTPEEKKRCSELRSVLVARGRVSKW